MKDYLPEDHDIAICRLYGKGMQMPSLILKKPSMKVYDEIFMCGYPSGGDFTLNIFDKKYVIRLSPLLQTGRISSLMPTDNTKQPIGIQTDIVGTGGSSGSPIINANSGQVIGLAQQVISSKVGNWKGKSIGFTNTGLIWAISFFFLHDGIYQMIEKMKEFEDEMVIPKVKKPHDI